MHCTNAISSTPSCQDCRVRFSDFDAELIWDNEWMVYMLVTYLKKYRDTEFETVKQGRKAGASAWGTLRDNKDRWGYYFTIKNHAGNVSHYTQ